jgi:hypothetical protein
LYSTVPNAGAGTYTAHTDISYIMVTIRHIVYPNGVENDGN